MFDEDVFFFNIIDHVVSSSDTLFSMKYILFFCKDKIGINFVFTIKWLLLLQAEVTLANF